MASIISATAIVMILKKAVKIASVIGMYIDFCALLPFKLVFPNELMSIFTSGWFYNLISTVSFFIPVNFILSCLFLILASKYSSVITNFINWIIKLFI